MSTLRELLQDIADRGKPGDLVKPSWHRARRMRTRRRLLTVLTGVAAALTLILVPVAIRNLASTPTVPPLSSPSATPSTVASPLPSLDPDKMPGGWIWGGGPNINGGTLVFDRVRGSLRGLPYDWSIPAPKGDLVYVTNQDHWTGILNLQTGGVRQLQAAGRGEWSVGIPQWSADGTRLLRADGNHIYITNAKTGVSNRVNPQGGCGGCTHVVWLPGETEVGIPVSANETEGLQIYSVETGAKLRRVPWYLARLSGFSPDGRYVVAKLDNRSAIVETATGARVASIPVDDTRTAYWAGPDLVLAVEQGGAVVYSLQGNRIAEYPRPSEFTEDELPSFTLIRPDMR